MLRRLFDSPYTYFALAALLVLGWFASQVEIRPPALLERPIEDLLTLKNRDDVNVVFILVDTLRADRLGSYGYERDTTPVLDRLASSGIRFSNVMAQSSWTKASMASMWMGVYPSRNQIIRYPHGISEEVKMPAEILREHGFYNGGVVRNGWVEPNFGFAQGFHVYFIPQLTQDPRKIQRHQLSSNIGGSDFDLIEAAREFLRSNKHRRFLLYIHMMDVHQYAFGTNFARYGSTYSDYYDNALAWTDANIGFLVEELLDLDLFKKTLLVVAADHGEEFREHGGEGHAKSLYEEVVHVPLIMVPPFVVKGGVVVDELAANIDIWPTILDLLGFEALQGAQGKSLVPLMLGEGEDLKTRSVYSQLDRTWGQVESEDNPILAVTTAEWKQIRIERSGRTELYDRSKDASEQENLAASQTEVVAKLGEQLDRYLTDEDGAGSAAPEPTWNELDEMRLNQLRALGYAVGGKKR